MIRVVVVSGAHFVYRRKDIHLMYGYLPLIDIRQRLVMKHCILFIQERTEFTETRDDDQPKQSDRQRNPPVAEGREEKSKQSRMRSEQLPAWIGSPPP